MKREKSQLITHKYIKTLTEYYKQLHANTVNNPEETDNFLQTYSPPKLNQEEDNLKRPVTRSEIESVTKQTKHPINKMSRPDSFTGEFYQTHTKELILILLEEEGTLPKTFYKATITLISESDDTTKK